MTAPVPDLLVAFAFERPAVPVSLYRYAPVFLVRDRRGAWVVKRTGQARSEGAAIGRWLAALRARGVRTVAPAGGFGENPRALGDGGQWVVYPYIEAAEAYTARAGQIEAAGALLGAMHAADGAEARGLRAYPAPPVRDAAWVTRHAEAAAAEMRAAGRADGPFRAAVAGCLGAVGREAAGKLAGLPLAGGSFDFKASNLVFAPEPVLIDPDHAARLPRVYDLAVAALLFHNDLPSAPAQLWLPAEWAVFLAGYARHVRVTDHERAAWPAVLRLAWLDQGVWLLGNFPEGWRDPKEAAYLYDLATVDLGRFDLDKVLP